MIQLTDEFNEIPTITGNIALYRESAESFERMAAQLAKIDFEEFCEFYKTISVSIEEDKYFEIMVLSEWGIKKDGKSLYQKDWNIQDE